MTVYTVFENSLVILINWIENLCIYVYFKSHVALNTSRIEVNYNTNVTVLLEVVYIPFGTNCLIFDSYKLSWRLKHIR